MRPLPRLALCAAGALAVGVGCATDADEPSGAVAPDAGPAAEPPGQRPDASTDSCPPGALCEPYLCDSAPPPECPAPTDPSTLGTLCGWIGDAGHGGGFTWDKPAPCDNDSGGACDIPLAFFDAVEYAADPEAAIPLPVGLLSRDTCGYFVAHDVPAPPSGFVGIRVHRETWLETWTSVILNPGDVRDNLPAWFLSHRLDRAWTETAGAPFGEQTFAARGAVLYRFLADGVPRSGVAFTDSEPAFFFSDRDAQARSHVEPSLTATGANGAALRTDTTDGIEAKNAPPGCEWRFALARPVPGRLAVVDVVAYAIGEPGEPCRAR